MLCPQRVLKQVAVVGVIDKYFHMKQFVFILSMSVVLQYCFTPQGIYHGGLPNNSYIKNNRIYYDDNAQEIILYAQDGNAYAYILAREKDKIIYTWGGLPVAYLLNTNLPNYQNSLSYEVYHFNGELKGYFVDGILFDSQGNQIGWVKESLQIATRALSAKSARSAIPAKSARRFYNKQIWLTHNFSNMSLNQWLN